jgi:hypothetical protein
VRGQRLRRLPRLRLRMSRRSTVIVLLDKTLERRGGLV